MKINGYEIVQCELSGMYVVFYKGVIKSAHDKYELAFNNVKAMLFGWIKI